MQTGFIEHELDDFIQQTMHRWQVPGLALAIVNGDEVVHTAGYGLRDRTRGLPVTPDTLFPIASCTKAFTAMALGLLVEEGKLTWDTPVREILTGWQMADPAATATLTVRDMLSHRCGLPAHDWLWLGSYFNRREALARLRYLEPSAPLRSRFQYQNIMYMLAALLVEELAGMSWERFVQERILNVLGMTRSNFSTLVTQADSNHARPHIVRNGQVRETRFWEQDGENCITGAAGTICSTASEMARWLTLQMNGGKLGAVQLVRPETLEAMHLPNIFIDDPDARHRLGYEFTSYGMGWFLRSHKGHKLVTHGGSVDGFWNTLYFLPRERLGVLALTNCDEGCNPVPAIVCLTLLDRLLGLEASNWEDLIGSSCSLPTEPPKAAASAAQPPRPLAAYVGEYEHPGYGRVSICAANEGLQMSLNGRWTFAVSHIEGDVFEAREAEWLNCLKLTFAADAHGKIGVVSIPLELAVDAIVFPRLA